MQNAHSPKAYEEPAAATGSRSPRSQATQVPSAFSRQVVAHSPVLTILPAGLCISIFSSSLPPPFPPPPPSLPRLLCPFLFLRLRLIPFSLGLTHPLSLSPLHPPFSVSPLLSTGPSCGNRGIWRSLGTTETQPSLAPLPCGCSRKGGQRAEEGGTAAKRTGAQLWLRKKRGNKELGDRGCGCQRGKGCLGV